MRSEPLKKNKKTVYWPRKEQKKKRADNLKYKKAVIELDKSIGYHLSSRIKKPIDAKLKGQPEWLLKYMSNAIQTFELLNHELKSKQSLPSMGIIQGIIEVRCISLQDAVTQLNRDKKKLEEWLQDSSSPSPDFIVPPLDRGEGPINQALIRVYQFSRRYLSFFRLVEGDNVTLSNIVAGIKYVVSASHQLEFWDAKLLMGLYFELIEDSIRSGDSVSNVSSEVFKVELLPLQSVIRGKWLKRTQVDY